MRKPWIYVIAVVWLLAACRHTPSPTPVPTRPHAAWVSPTVGTPLPSRVPGKTSGTSVAHLPWMGQHSAPTPPPSITPSPTPSRPSAPTSTLAPTPTPSPVSGRQVHVPYVLSHPPLQQEEPLPTGEPMFAVVIDASATAGQPWDGQPVTRWQAQRDVIPRVLVDTLSDARITLQRLGGGAEACEGNTHSLAVMQPVGSLQWAQVWTGVQPAGSAPLAEALLQAVDTFPARVHRPVLLIASGDSICGEDPCNAARVLERSDADVTVHVVDMSDDPSGRAVLRCIAEATGGTYRHVDSPQALEEALRTAIHHARGGQLRVEVVGVKGRPLFPAVVVGRGSHIVRTFDAWTDADLAAGTYTVTVGTPLPSIFENVTVTRGQRTRLHIPLGELHLHLVDAQQRPIFAEVSLSTPSLGTFFGSEGESIVVPLPTGYYTASVILETASGPLAFARNVPVVVGSVTERTIRVPVTRLRINLVRRGQPADGFVTLARWDAPDVQIAGGWASGEITFLVPAGWYRLEIGHYGDPLAAHYLASIHVDDPAHTPEVHHVHYVDSGTLRVLETASDGQPLSGWVRIYPSHRSAPVLAEGPVPAAFTLPTGTYDVRVTGNDGHDLWAWDVVLQPQQQVDVVLTRPQARVWLETATPWGEPRVAHMVLYREPDHVSVLDAPSPWRAVVSPGTYRAEFDGYSPISHMTASDTFTLADGDAYTLTTTLPLASVVLVPANADEVDVAVFAHEATDVVLGRVRSGLPRLLLPTGHYAFLVQDVDNPERRVWVEDVKLEEGDRKQYTVHFPVP